MYPYPHTIENGNGERITFLKHVKAGEEDYLEVENFVMPDNGPPMHVHFQQDEGLTIVKGRIGIQVLGNDEEFYGPGETRHFKAGIPHRFWNAGSEPLICKGYIRPAHNCEYFLTELYRSTKENGGRPDTFDAAYLLHRYRTEFDMFAIPAFVKKFIFPVIRLTGMLLGKHKRFANAPAPLPPKK